MGTSPKTDKRSREQALIRENEILNKRILDLEAILKMTNERLNQCTLTGLFNRDYFNSFFPEQIQNDVQYMHDSTLMFITVDNMEWIIHNYGYEESAATLKNIAYLLKRAVRVQDKVSRIASSLFACYLPEYEKEEIIVLAETILNSVSTAEFFIEDIIVSIGVCSLSEVIESHPGLEHYDGLLYKETMRRTRAAKQRGRNMVIDFSPAGNRDQLVKKVLLVDTDAIFLAVLERSLRNYGYEIITASDGDMAYKLALQKRPNLVITEVMLPKHDAFFLRKRMMQDSETKNIPFILISHLKHEENVVRATRLGIFHYFSKPFMLSELTSVARNYLDEEEP